MPNKWKTASVLLYIICVIMMLFAIGVFVGTVVRGQLLPNMESIIGMTTAEIVEIAPGWLNFTFVFLSVMSALMFSFAITLWMLIRGPFSRNEPEVRTIIFTGLGLFLLFAEIISFAQFPNTPWPIWSLCVILGLIAFFKSKSVAKSS